MRVSGQGCAFWGLHNIRLHLGFKPQKNFPKGAGICISQPNQRSTKIAIYVTDEDSGVEFHRLIDYREHYRRNAKLGQRVVKGSCDLLLEFWDTLHISGWLKLEVLKLASTKRTRCTKCKIRPRLKEVMKGVTWPTF